MSKMGISTVSSYRAAQLFEIVGLSSEVVDLCFRHTLSRIEGADFEDLENDTRYMAMRAWNPRSQPEQGVQMTRPKAEDNPVGTTYDSFIRRTVRTEISVRNFNL